MFRLHKKCFTGAEAVSHVLSFLHSRDDPTYQKAGRENALKLAMQLMKQGMCVSVSGNAPMSDNDTLFRLTDAAYEKTGIEKPTDSGPSNPTSPEPAPLGKALGGSATQLNSPDVEMRNRSQSTSSGTSRFSRLLSWKPGSKGEAVSSPVSRETSTGVRARFCLFPFFLIVVLDFLSLFLDSRAQHTRLASTHTNATQSALRWVAIDDSPGWLTSGAQLPSQEHIHNQSTVIQTVQAA
jgi:hypothetical protein